MDADLEQGCAGQAEEGVSVNAGVLLGFLAGIRLAAFGLNFWLYCHAGKAGVCDGTNPDVSTVGGHNGAHAEFRFATAVATVLANDFGNWLVLSAAFARPTLAKHAPVPVVFFKFLLFSACILDGLQAALVDAEYHWAAIQVAGALMLLVLWVLLVTLWKDPEPRSRCCLGASTFLYVLLCLILIAVLVLYHTGFGGGRNLWTRLEYTALVFYTGLLAFLGLALPDARVRLRMIARLEVLPVESSESGHNGLLSAARPPAARAGAVPKPAAAPPQPKPKAAVAAPASPSRGRSAPRKNAGGRAEVALVAGPGSVAEGAGGSGAAARQQQLMQKKADMGNPKD